MKILIALDSFKGSLSSLEAGETLKSGIESSTKDFEIKVLPVADGGEGSLEMIAEGKKRHLTHTKDPLGREIESYFLSKEFIFYIEMALTSGLTLLHEEERNPLLTNSYGVGQQIMIAKELGAKKKK